MNWTRGLLRVWAVVAISWIALQAWLMRVAIKSAWDGWVDAPLDGKHQDYDVTIYNIRLEIAEWIALPPLALLLFWYLDCLGRTGVSQFSARGPMTVSLLFADSGS